MFVYCICFRFVFVNLGGNSIHARCKPGDIYFDIIEIVERLYQAGVERVFVASIIERGRFPSWTGLNISSFNKVRRAVNKKLKHHLKADFVEVDKRLIYPRHYDQDLVHPGSKEGGLKVLQYTIINSFRKTL